MSLQRAQSLVLIAASEFEHQRVECLDLLLQFLTSGFAGSAERFADIGEVAERDCGLLSNRPLCGGNGLGLRAYYGEEGRALHGANGDLRALRPGETSRNRLVSPVWIRHPAYCGAIGWR